jgi:hypothetical protein
LTTRGFIAALAAALSFRPPKPTRARAESLLSLPETCFFPAMKILHFSPDLAVRISGSNLQ